MNVVTTDELRLVEIKLILERKKNGIDCTEAESATIKYNIENIKTKIIKSFFLYNWCNKKLQFFDGKSAQDWCNTINEINLYL